MWFGEKFWCGMHLLVMGFDCEVERRLGGVGGELGR